MAKKLPAGIEWDSDRSKYRVTVYVNGKRYRLGRFDTLTDAKAAATIAKADIARGIFIPPSQRRADAKLQAAETGKDLITVAQLADDWIRDLAEQVESGMRKQSTLREYKSVLDRHVLPALGSHRVRDLTPQDVQALADKARTPAVRTKIIANLRRLSNLAIEREIIAVSPVKLRQSKPKPSALGVGQIASPQQVAALAEAMPVQLRLSVLLAAWCSLRQGETLGLQRGDFIDLEGKNPRLRVARQWNQKMTPPGYTSPKNGQARMVALPHALIQAIREHLDMYVGKKASAPVFPSPYDPSKPLSQTNHNLVWNRAREAVGLPAFRFHDLRHTGLTLYAQQGATLAEIMERGGHSDVEVAMRYQHAAEDRARRLADSLPVEL